MLNHHPPSPLEERSTKKFRTQVTSPTPWQMENEQLNNNQGKDTPMADKPSYRQKLAGDRIVREAVRFEESSMFELDKIKVVASSAECPYPRVIIEDDLLESIRKPWQDTLVLKMMGKAWNINWLSAKLDSMWKLNGDFDLLDLGFNCYILKIRDQAKSEFILTEGPWMVAGHFLVVRKWIPNFQASMDRITTAITWIRVEELAVEYYKEAIVYSIARGVDFQMLESFPPDSEEQQAHVTAIQDMDGYNWGYNPVIWGVPKGSYASDPNGSCCIIEFRKMVQALNRIGLRVVLDVVYNHLHASGPYDENSVLDKIVPGYYLRRNLDGFIENSTCVNNTASEHFMVERLIIDDLLHWTVHYKVDGFRFDLMGHIMKRTMVKARGVLHNLSKQRDGVDGSSIYIYGEGWNFGEVANNGRGVNASQFNLFGTGIGSFNDRIRDAMLGGSPFGHLLQQGFITGLFLEPNGHDHGSESAVDQMLGISKDHIQVGMAANLKDFVLINHEGEEVKGCEVSTYDGSPVAYASCPIETVKTSVPSSSHYWLVFFFKGDSHSDFLRFTVNYVSAHDNETLFDIVSLKTPVNISLDARCRMNHLATSIIALSQGIPFFHAGDEILRSKSLDRDSYNSGDWFNRLDFSYNSNNWGVGLPPKEKNERYWPLMKIRLADPSFMPQRSHILAALDNFSTFISIRYSSPLFRLSTANAIQDRVQFHNTGPSWVRGVIVMSINDGHQGAPGLAQLDPIYSYIVVIINVCPTDVRFTTPDFRGKNLQLHPIQVPIFLTPLDYFFFTQI
ncbi:hypothetical protein RD792_000301 [Penstemon davidsonii]|uniref:Uncharacterized protein n=1 Tax=Penstemon davidsonii TaxID=160366 RepID=A0ABR0DV81_9LAMI|nr:hypothetical protein RD792_000301 [Penstemon davidsonii]